MDPDARGPGSSAREGGRLDGPARSVRGMAAVRQSGVEARVAETPHEERIATGGMAEVFRSVGADGVEYAIKRLHPRCATDPEYRRMFHAEGRLAVLFRHPNILRTFASGIDGAGPFLRMERLHGADLRTILTREKRRARLAEGIALAARPGRGVAVDTAPSPRLPPISLGAALGIVIAAADGLHYAHEFAVDAGPLELVHRDVSPHNIFVDIQGGVKVFDFGIARTAQRGWDTQQGTLKGKVPYMAPEQLRATELDRRTDIYALGVVLYELTVGKLPYPVTQHSDVPLMLAIARHDVVSPSEVIASYPQALEAVVLRALAFRSAQRFQTAAEFAEALRTVVARLELSVAPEVISLLVDEERVESLRAAPKVALRPREDVARRLPSDEAEPASPDVAGEARSPHRSDETTEAGSVWSPACRAIAAVEQIGPSTVFSLAGSVDELFGGAALGGALRGPTVLDVSALRRVTSYGVREWFQFLAALKDTPCALFGCTDALLSQFEMVRGFRGDLAIASFEALFHCNFCGHDFVALLSSNLSEALRAGDAFATRTCLACGRMAHIEGDLAPLRALFAPLPEAFVPAIEELSRRREQEERALVDKSVRDGKTLLTLRRPPGKVLRWHRLLDGVEGALRLDLSACPALSKADAIAIAQALRKLSDVTSLEVPRAPITLFDAICAHPPEYPVRILKVACVSACSLCESPRVFVASAPSIAGGMAGADAALRCVHCASEFSGTALEQVPAAPSSASLPFESDAPVSSVDPLRSGPRAHVRSLALVPPVLPQTSTPERDVQSQASKRAHHHRDGRSPIVPALFLLAFTIALGFVAAKTIDQMRRPVPDTAQEATSP